MVQLLLLICLAGPLLAQAVPIDPDYYRNNRERFDSYIFRTYTDPARLGWLLIDSAKDTCYKDPHQWDRSAESYSFRVASGWGRRIVRNTAQYGFETLLREDSRYRPSGEKGLRKRMAFAIRSSVLSYKPDGSREPAYGRIAAGMVGAAVSSTWHPQSIGPATLARGMGHSAIDRAGNNLLSEFAPDLKRVGRKTWNQILRK
jgi:hypothetical protein